MPHKGRGKAWDDAALAASYENAENLGDLIAANPERSIMALYSRTRFLRLPKNPRIKWMRYWIPSREIDTADVAEEKGLASELRIHSRKASYRIAEGDNAAIVAAERRLLAHVERLECIDIATIRRSRAIRK